MPVANYTTSAIHIRCGGTRLPAFQPPEWDSFGFGGASLPGHPAAADVLDNWCMQVMLNQVIANGDPDQRMWLSDASISVRTSCVFANMNFSGSLTVEVLMDPLPLPMKTSDGAIVQGTEFDPRNYTLPWRRRVIHRRYFTSADWPILDNTPYTLILDSDAISTLNSIITDPRWPARTATRALMFFFYIENGGNPGAGPGGLTSNQAGPGNGPFFTATCRYSAHPWQTGDSVTERPGTVVPITTSNYDNDSVNLSDGYSGPESGRIGVHDGVSRLDRCPKCGNLSLRSRWVRDGYIEGLRVCPECWDPEDPDNRNWPDPPERPLVGEDD